MRVCYLPQDFSGSGFYRLIFPLRELEKRGHWAKTPLYRKIARKGDMDLYSFDLTRIPRADVYVFQMPLDEVIVPVIRTLRRDGFVTVGEADDNSLQLPDWHPSFAGTHPRNNPARNRDHRARAFQACDAMTVSTPALADEYRRLNATVEVLPNYLLGEMWANVTPQYALDRDRLRIGWMGRSRWRKGDLEILKPWLGGFLRRHPDVDFVAAGDAGVHDLLEVPEGQRVSYPPVEFPKGLAEITATMDVGLVPLEPNRFNESKSYLKGLEYAACGVPCVASDTQQYRAWCSDENGLLAESPEDWVAALERLVADRDLVRRMGRAAEAKALRNTIDRHAGRWEDFYRCLIERKTGKARAEAPRALTGLEQVGIRL